MNYVLILVGSILVNNFVMNKFMGICPFWAFPKRWKRRLAWAWRSRL